MNRNGTKLDADLLTAAEIELLMRQCSRRAPTGVRNRALIAVCWRCGLRIGEALAHAPKDFDPDSGTLVVQRGKGGKRHGRDAGGGYRVVLGAVAAPPVHFPHGVHDLLFAPFAYWTKAGLAIRASKAVVTVSLPKDWRDRARIVWGAPGTPAASVRFAPCPSTVATWNGYAGGFYLRAHSACVPLIFRVGQRTATVRFGIGQRC